MFLQSYQSIRKPRLGSQIIKGHPLAKGLVGCWLMNENAGKKIYDLSGNRNTGTFNGNISWVSGPTGINLYSAGGNSDYVQAALPSGISASNPITLIIKAKRISGTNLKGLFCVQAATGDAGQILIAYYEAVGTRNNFSVNHLGGSGSYGRAAATAITQTDWNVFVITNAGGSVQNNLYVNGILSNGAASGGWSGSSTANIIDIGRGIPTYGSNCQIEYFHLYNRALSAAEVRQLYTSPFQFIQGAQRKIYYVAAGNIKKIAGVSWSNVSKVGGVAKASIKKIAEVTAS